MISYPKGRARRARGEFAVRGKTFDLKRIGLFALLLVLASALCVACRAGVAHAEEAKETYWSAERAPVIYGAIEISIPLGAVDEFDFLDPRFRTFANDFEDGDIDAKLVANDVQADREGDYNLKYEARDSDGNLSAQTVPVHVTAGGEVVVKRRMYAIASNWSTSNAGFSRCDSGDRQILGVYMPAGSAIDIRVLSNNLLATTGNGKLRLSLLNNDSQTELSADISYGEYTTMRNTVDVGCVPLMTSPVLKRGQDLLTTFEIEVKYDVSEVDVLDFYHHGDFRYAGHTEEDFKAKWEETQAYATYIEGETASFVLPLCDFDWIKDPSINKNIAFDEFEGLFAYFDKVIYRFNQLVGLSFDPDKPTDQCVRAKYLVKANIHGAGLAYYSGNHIGFNGKSVAGFFTIGWGTLHEIAHGYQGYLGKGAMGLGEVSNNILAHYVQIDRSIYPNEDDWLGKPNDSATIKDEQGNQKQVSKEYARNYNRLKGMTFDKQDVGDKLYFIINLFDAIDGDKTYARMFSFFREGIESGQFTSATPNQDVYALFFAREYGINVLPYFGAWKLETSEAVAEEAERASSALCVLEDAAGEFTDEIMEEKGLSARFVPVRESMLEECGLTGELKVRMNIDRPSLLEGKTLLLQKRGSAVASASVHDGVADLGELPAGSYFVRVPFVGGYDTRSLYVTVGAGKNVCEADYSAIDDAHYTKLLVTGPNNTVGLSIELLENNKKGILSLGAANLGNQYAQYSPSEVFVSVKVKDKTGKTLVEHSVNGGENYFTRESVDPVELALEYGYTVEVFSKRPEYVHIVSLVSGKPIAEFDANENNFSYEITAGGFRPVWMREEDFERGMYGALKEETRARLAEAKEYFDEHASELDVKYEARSQKDKFLHAYALLDPEDRTDYDELYERISRGGVPVLKTKGGNEFAIDGADIDWSKLIEAFDAEDGDMRIYDGNCVVASDLSLSIGGKHHVSVRVADSDGNLSNAVELVLNLRGVEEGEKDLLNPLSIALICVVAALVLGGTAAIVAISAIGKKKRG